MDIAEANKNNATKWQYGYSAKVRYCPLPYTNISQYKEIIKNPYLTISTHSLSLSLFQTSYKMSGMHPSDWDSLVGRFAKDDDLFQEFHRNYVKRVAKIAKCTGNCKGALLCEMVRSRTGDDSKCHF